MGVGFIITLIFVAVLLGIVARQTLSAVDENEHSDHCEESELTNAAESHHQDHPHAI